MKSLSLVVVSVVSLTFFSDLVKASALSLNGLKGVDCSVPDVTPEMNKKFLDFYHVTELKMAQQKCAGARESEKENCNFAISPFEVLDSIKIEIPNYLNGRTELPPVVHFSFDKVTPSANYPNSFGKIEGAYSFGTILGASSYGPTMFDLRQNYITYIDSGASNEYQIEQTRLGLVMTSGQEFVGDYSYILFSRPMKNNRPFFVEEKLICHPIR